MGAMPDEHPFPHLCETAGRLEGRGASDLRLDDLRQLLCADCDFFHEDHEDDLECSCFRMLRLLLKSGRLTPAQLSQMLAP